MSELREKIRLDVWQQCASTSSYQPGILWRPFHVSLNRCKKISWLSLISSNHMIFHFF